MSKEVVVPGEVLSTENKQLGAHTFMRENKIYADVLGLKNESDDRVSVVPLRGKYIPVENDVVIGVVRNEKFAGYDIEINSFYPSFVNKQDLREALKVGDILSAKIVKVSEMNEADLGMVRPLRGGELVSVTPVKIPRIIGKNASMLNAVKNGTGSSIMVGRNGLIWANGGNTALAVETIQRIEEFAHVENLTNDIQRFLAAKTGSGVPGTHGPTNESSFETGFEGGYGRSSFRGRGPPRGGGFGGPRGGGDRGGFRGGDRGRPQGGGFGNRDRGFSGSRDRGGQGFGGPRSGGFSPRPRSSFGGPGGPRNDSQGFRPNRRFGNQYDGPSGGSDRPSGGFNRGPRDSNQSQSFDRRKRFPRENRVRGDEDPSFD